MTSSAKIVDYFGAGVVASRPASPSVPSGCGALYWETDNLKLDVWDGSSWHQAVAVGPQPPSFVQMKIGAASTLSNVVMTSAPTNGDLLVALMVVNATGINTNNIGTGWHLLYNLETGSDDSFAAFYKWAGASESTTQTPYSVAINGVIAIYEYSGARGVCTFGGTRAQTGTSISEAGIIAQVAEVAVCGVFSTYQAVTLPTSITGATADSTATGGSGTGQRGGAGYHTTYSTAGTETVTAAYGSSVTVTDAWVAVV